NHQLWDTNPETLPVSGTIPPQFNDPGMNRLSKEIREVLTEKTDTDLKSDYHISDEMSEKVFVSPPKRVRYLSEICENNRGYDEKAEKQVGIAQKLYGVFKTLESVAGSKIKLDKNGIDEESLKDAETDSNRDFIGLLKKE